MTAADGREHARVDDALLGADSLLKRTLSLEPVHGPHLLAFLDDVIGSVIEVSLRQRRRLIFGLVDGFDEWYSRWSGLDLDQLLVVTLLIVVFDTVPEPLDYLRNLFARALSRILLTMMFLTAARPIPIH